MIVLDTSVQQSSRPFRVAVPQATIDRILNRVREAQFPDRLDGNDWRYGTDWDYMKALADYWAKEYDWRKAETESESVSAIRRACERLRYPLLPC